MGPRGKGLGKCRNGIEGNIPFHRPVRGLSSMILAVSAQGRPDRHGTAPGEKGGGVILKQTLLAVFFVS
jgi:hypothetical protein